MPLLFFSLVLFDIAVIEFVRFLMIGLFVTRIRRVERGRGQSIPLLITIGCSVLVGHLPTTIDIFPYS